MYVLSGFYAIAEDDTGFIVPYFCLHGSNYTYVQEVENGYVVSKFSLVSGEGLIGLDYIPSTRILSVGMKALLAFQVKGEIYCGTIEEIRSLNLDLLITEDRPIFNSGLAILFSDKKRHMKFVEESSLYFGEFSGLWKDCEYAGYDVSISFQHISSAPEINDRDKSFDHLLSNPEAASWAQDWFLQYIYAKDSIKLLEIGMWWLASFDIESKARKSSPALVIYGMLNVDKFYSEAVLVAENWVRHALTLKVNSRVNIDLFGGVSRDFNKKDLISYIVQRKDNGKNIKYESVMKNYGSTFRGHHFDLCVLMSDKERSYLAIDLISEIGSSNPDSLRIVRNFLHYSKWIVHSRKALKHILLESNQKNKNWCELCAVYLKNFPDDYVVINFSIDLLEKFIREGDEDKMGINSINGWYFLWESINNIDSLRIVAREIGFKSLQSLNMVRSVNFYTRCWPKIYLEITKILDDSMDFYECVELAKDWLNKNGNKLKFDWKYKEVKERVDMIQMFERAE